MSDEDFRGMYQPFPSAAESVAGPYRRGAWRSHPQPLAGTFEEFSSDLRRAIGAWRDVPWLPAVSAIVGGGGPFIQSSSPSDPPPVLLEGLAPGALVVGAVLLLAFGLFSLGWSGSERLTYSRVWSGDGIRFGEALRAAWGYVGRFIVLGLILLIPLIVVSLTLNAALGSLLGGMLTGFLLFAVLTFVTPALVYDEDRATDALRTGWELLRRQGRRAAWYALLPPAVLSATSAASYLPGPVGWLGFLVSGILALALKGAIASAYLRMTEPPAPPAAEMPPV